MPADATKQAAVPVAGTVAQVTLLTDVQISTALGSDFSGFMLPAAAEFERWAQRAFEIAAAHGWDKSWRARTVADAGTIEESELCIRLVDAAESATLNATWRDKESPTNVLSFEADIVAGHYAPLGDLVLCVPVIAQEAAEQNKPIAHHCAHLVVHGVLHLLGFDHLIDSEAEAMEAMEATVLSEFGIANPYE